MSEQEISPQDEGRANDKKKLRKRERKLRERLREAKHAQADALAHLRQAEARMRKRMARVQELEDRLDAIHQRLGTLQVKGSTVVTMITTETKVLIEAPSSQNLVLEKDGSEASELLAMEGVAIDEVFTDSPSENKDEVSGDDVVMQARKARAVAEVAEEAVRDAVERVAEVEKYLEQFESARHLLQDAERLQTEADKATEIAREAKEVVRVAEGLVKEEQREIAVATPIVDEERTEQISEMDRDDVGTSSEHPSPLEVAQVEEIEEEEDTLETVAAMIIADAAGIAAARAEAVAEACSARTREARVLALKADLALEAVRVAISEQKLSGEGAEIALKAAEREATHTHAVLADAESAEERALNAAMNAEAEAEVAEGMAFAASSVDERDEKRRDEVSAAYDTVLPSDTGRNANEDEDEDTLKMPVIRPQQE